MTPELTSIIMIVSKALVVFGLGLYIVFALVILRQEQLMADVLEESFEPVLRLSAILHLAASVFVFILALLLL
jgi:hypothetical protein